MSDLTLQCSAESNSDAESSAVQVSYIARLSASTVLKLLQHGQNRAAPV